MSTTIPKITRSPPSSDDEDTQSDSTGWEDQNPLDDQDESVPIRCIFCDLKFDGGARDIWSHCLKEHGFDWKSVVKSLGLDDHEKIKLINYLRKNPKTSPGELTKEAFASEDYLNPTLPDDPLLYQYDDGEEDEEIPVSFDPRTLQTELLTSPAAAAYIKSLTEQISTLETTFARYRKDVADNYLEKAEKSEVVYTKPTAVGEGKRDDDSHYFESYSGNDIHETMLKDTVRTEAYRDFIYENKHVFKDKIVLDVGCGTGILSMFCAKAGAAKVFAVDNSNIINKARENVYENGLDGIITCIRGKVEEIVLPVKQVDIIVSEWMGYCLLYEAMLDSVLYARDKYLAPDGLMVPSECKLLIAAMHDSDYMNDNVHFWNNVYGFRMSGMKDRIKEEVVIAHLKPTSFASEPVVFLNLPLHTIKIEELVFTKKFEVEIKDNVETLDAFVIYFDNYFATSRGEGVSDTARAEKWSGDGVAFTTGPGGKETHWRQGVLMVQDGPGLYNTGQKIEGEVTYRKSKDNSRELEIEISWEAVGKNRKHSQLWHMR
ncbi:hypothetical protein ABW19_dt0202008 [Dactylella cylindrospora]|nr:hypothetical protein ABW19_dt0202008 [Dactylella cylindrospora]